MKLILSAFLLLAGFVCLITFHQIGSSVDADGVLHEPFALLPVGYALCFLGGLGVLIFGGHKFLSRKGR